MDISEPSAELARAIPSPSIDWHGRPDEARVLAFDIREGDFDAVAAFMEDRSAQEVDAGAYFGPAESLREFAALAWEQTKKAFLAGRAGCSCGMAEPDDEGSFIASFLWEPKLHGGPAMLVDFDSNIWDGHTGGHWSALEDLQAEGRFLDIQELTIGDDIGRAAADNPGADPGSVQWIRDNAIGGLEGAFALIQAQELARGVPDPAKGQEAPRI